MDSRLVYMLCGAAVAGSLVACAGSQEEQAVSNPASTSATAAAPTSAVPPATARTAADTIRAAVPEVTDLIDLTEDNDANNLIGRPNGYTAATVVVDSRMQCDIASPGVDCGATVEQFADEASAQKRADYVKRIRESAPELGQEWTTVKANLVLRVTGLLKPSAAKQYQSAFEAVR